METLGEIDDFLDTVHAFGKKFYTVNVHGGEEGYWLKIYAIGISRDLIYRIRWIVDAESYDCDHCDPDLVRQGDIPIHGWIPKVRKDLVKLYPNVGQVPNETGEYHWITIFTSRGFIRMDDIETVE